MKAGEIVSVLEDAAPLHTQEDWDNSGLCIGSLDNEVSGAMLGLDCTLSLMEEAGFDSAFCTRCRTVLPYMRRIRIWTRPRPE